MFGASPNSLTSLQKRLAPFPSVARLVAEFGAAYRLTDWLSERTADCPQKNQAGVTRACGAVMPDLVDL